MNWIDLCSDYRLGDTENQSHQGSYRNPFEMDYDRIIFLEGFRRLQNKTQVIPLPDEAFVHNRLTHSLEVSSVGRSLGKKVGKEIGRRYPELKSAENLENQFGAVVAAAALAHDMGNPPFGHAGEKAISEFFSLGEGQAYRKHLTPGEWGDLSNFEGNAHGFRLLNHSNSGIQGGARLTFSTLAAFTKYPKESIKTDAKGRSQKKYGVFQSEKEVFSELAKRMHLKPYPASKNTLSFYRHPLAFLVEAADDICYTVIDFEDGYGLGIIPFEQFEAEMSSICGAHLNQDRYRKIKDEKEKVSYLRAIAINTLVDAVTKVFLDKEVEIRTGAFDEALIDHTPFARHAKQIINESYLKIYTHPVVVERELTGFEVLKGLLTLYAAAMEDIYSGKASYYHQKIVSQFPRNCLDSDEKPHQKLYDRLLNITSYVASMTDEQAIKKYRQLKGISMPQFK